MKGSIWGQMFNVVSLVILVSCSGGAPTESAAVPDVAGNQPATEAPAAENGDQQVQSLAGPGQVIVAGTYTLTYTPIKSVVTDNIGGGHVIFLQIESEYNSGVRIFLPEGIQPGTYDIASLIDVEEGVSGRLDFYANGTMDYFESTGGQIVFASTEEAYTGNFTFNAADPRDLSRTVIVTGNFENVTK